MGAPTRTRHGRGTLATSSTQPSQVESSTHFHPPCSTQLQSFLGGEHALPRVSSRTTSASAVGPGFVLTPSSGCSKARRRGERTGLSRFSLSLPRLPVQTTAWHALLPVPQDSAFSRGALFSRRSSCPPSCLCRQGQVFSVSCSLPSRFPSPAPSWFPARTGRETPQPAALAARSAARRGATVLHLLNPPPSKVSRQKEDGPHVLPSLSALENGTEDSGETQPLPGENKFSLPDSLSTKQLYFCFRGVLHPSLC